MDQTISVAADLGKLAALLRAGKLVAFPTETVYGLGADATNSDAVLSIYQTKDRPRFNPLIVHCADMEMAQTFVEFPPVARKLARFWPGPLTMVLPKKPGAGLSDLVTAGLDTVGIRIPAHPLALQLLRATGRPLAAPSANPSGKLSPTTAQQVIEGFAGAVPVLDGGPCSAGVESTILKVTETEIVQLRAGALAREDIEKLLGRKLTSASGGLGIQSPGMMASHYAPRAGVRLNATAPKEGEAFLGFGTIDFAGPNLSPSGDLAEAARNLFAMLHQLDASGARVIAVAPIPGTGLGEAINDRLRRAAAPRD